MSEDTKIETVEIAKKSRRAFVTTAAQVAITAPAVGLLLSASTKSASAATQYVPPLGDDGVFSDNPNLGNGDTFLQGGPADDLHGGNDIGFPAGHGPNSPT